MTHFKIKEFVSSASKDQAGNTVLQNNQGLILVDQTKTITPGNYMITIHKISSMPETIIEPTGDDSEEHN